MTLKPKKTNQVTFSNLLNDLDTCYAAIPRTVKLYGQISPKIALGGCQEGRFRDAYQPGEEETQIPEPMA